MTNGPLTGTHILEFAGIGPAPYCGQLLADMGASVTVVDRPNRSPMALESAPDRRGKSSVVLNLKTPEGVAIALDLIAKSDVLIEGNRPGVMERLGLGPDVCHDRNPALIYGRMTGWGQTGPWAQMAGHDINYISLTGALHAMGRPNDVPTPPLNLVGDFGGGSLFLATGILAALHEVKTTGKGRVIDAAILDGVNSMMGFFHGLHAAGNWTPARGDNWLDGGVPYYRCYETRDAKYVAVGSIEPQFLALLLQGVGLSAKEYGAQNDVAEHPRQTALLAEKFATKSRDEWAVIFAGTDACVTPVLTFIEAQSHEHVQTRGLLPQSGKLRNPAKAPAFSGAVTDPATDLPKDGQDTRRTLESLGLTEPQIAALLAKGVAFQR